MPGSAKPKTHLDVRDRARTLIKESWQSQANLSFFLVLLVTAAFILPALGFGRDDALLYADITFSLLLISGVAIAWGRHLLLTVAGFVASVALAMRWMAFLTPTRTMQMWAITWSLAAILLIMWILLSEVLSTGAVTPNRLQGAVAVYLLFGIGWAHAYHLAEIIHPGSFNNTGGQMSTVSDWAYFSFVTLSTVGYGDITPVRPVARTLAMGEALTGQLYLAVLIARLVAMEVITWQSKNDQHKSE